MKKIFDKLKYKGKFDDGRFFDPYGKYKEKITNEGSIYHLMESFLERLKVVGRFMTLMENKQRKRN